MRAWPFLRTTSSIVSRNSAGVSPLADSPPRASNNPPQASPTTAAGWADSKLTPRGSGIRPFRPAGLALTAGASFIARGFTGDPNGLARILVEAIGHKGFSFVQALSPCPTFRPEQMQWKRQVAAFPDEPTDDPITAAQRIQADNGMSTGVIFRRDYPVFSPRGAGQSGVESLASEFTI